MCAFSHTWSVRTLFWECDSHAVSRTVGIPDWKNHNDQAYSCLRDWSLSASLGPQLRAPLIPLWQHNRMLPCEYWGALSLSPIMPRGASFSDSRWKCFQVWDVTLRDIQHTCTGESSLHRLYSYRLHTPGALFMCMYEHVLCEDINIFTATHWIIY